MKIELTPRQSQAWRVLTDESNRDVCYGGAKGGGKSFLGCLWTYHWVGALSKLWGLQVSDRPPPVGFMGRKRGSDFKATTLETWKRVIPANRYVIKEQAKEIVIDGRAKIHFGGLDNEEDINKFNSAEYAFIFIDQAEETEQKEIAVLEGSLRLQINGIKPGYKKLWTCNPAECWLKDAYYRGARPGGIFIPALPTDNPFLPEDYINTLESAFGYDEALLRAYRDGDWDVQTSERIAIPMGLIDAMKSVKKIYTTTRRAVSCDPSLGGDECVIMVWDNYKIKEMVIRHWRDPMKIAAELAEICIRENTQLCGVDSSGGLGDAIVSRLAQLNVNAISINSARGPSDPDKFRTLRDEMWWNGRKLFENMDADYIEDYETRRQLNAVRYQDPQRSSGKFILEHKDETKKRIGRSPDRADCVIYGFYTLSQIREDRKFVFSEKQHREQFPDLYNDSPVTLNMGSYADDV